MTNMSFTLLLKICENVYYLLSNYDFFYTGLYSDFKKKLLNAWNICSYMRID